MGAHANAVALLEMAELARVEPRNGGRMGGVGSVKRDPDHFLPNIPY